VTNLKKNPEAAKKKEGKKGHNPAPMGRTSQTAPRRNNNYQSGQTKNSKKEVQKKKKAKVKLHPSGRRVSPVVGYLAPLFGMDIKKKKNLDWGYLGGAQ